MGASNDVLAAAPPKRGSTPLGIVDGCVRLVTQGGELFTARHPGVALIYDAAHRGASLLKRRLESDERWSEFVQLLGQTKSRTQQTTDAHLLAPSLRPKARYMNLERLLKWSRRLLALLDRGEGGGVQAALESTPVKHVEGWCKQYFPTTLQSQRRLAFSPISP